MATGRANHFFEGGLSRVIRSVAALGTSSVATVTKIIGAVPRNCVVTGVRIYGQAAVTGTSITAQVHARTLAGAAGNALLAAAQDIKFASADAAKTGVKPALTATAANRRLAAGQLLEVTVTASSITAGPGDLLVEVQYEPRT